MVRLPAQTLVHDSWPIVLLPFQAVSHGWEQDVLSIATRFRKAVEELKPQLRSVCFKDFPRGSCGDASILLGEVLEELNLGDWVYRSGKRADGQTHAWIERADVIVDITADQFPDISEGVVVTSDRTWYTQFAPTGGDGRIANLRNADAVAPVMADLEADFSLLLAETVAP